MTPLEIVMAIFRDRPGLDDRLWRLARRRGHGSPVDLPWSDVDRYFREWGIAFLNQGLSYHTPNELDIKLALDERVLLEAGGKDGDEDTEGSEAWAVERLRCTQAEIARRTSRMAGAL